MLDFTHLKTIKGQSSTLIENEIKKYAETIIGFERISKSLEKIFRESNSIYRTDITSKESLLLAIVLHDITGTYNDTLRKGNIVKIKEICEKWGIPYEYLFILSGFQNDIMTLINGEQN